MTDTFVLINELSGLAVDAEGGIIKPHVRLVLNIANCGPSQQFKLDGPYIVHVQSGFAIELEV